MKAQDMNSRLLDTIDELHRLRDYIRIIEMATRSHQGSEDVATINQIAHEADSKMNKITALLHAIQAEAAPSCVSNKNP